MDNEDQNQNTDTDVDEISEEEKNSETEALAEVKEEELKGNLAEEFGVNPEDEPELFEKLLKREQSHRERLSKTIKQKISWREKATKTSKKPEAKPKEGESPTGESNTFSEEKLNQLLDEREAKRDLESLSLPEDVETEVKDLAKLKGISVREAAKLPYISSRIEEVKREERIKSATPRRKSRGNYADAVDPSKPLDPNDFALDTEEGRQAWNDAKAARRKYQAKK